MELTDFIKSHGYDFSPDQLDGLAHEFEDSLGNKGWYIGSQLPSGKVTFTFGDWRDPAKKFSTSTQDLTDADLKTVEKLNKKNAKLKKERQLQTKKNASDMFQRWNQNPVGCISPYLNKKRLVHSKFTVVKEDLSLIIPIHDEAGEIWNLQTIDQHGHKQFMPFGRVQGVYHAIAKSGDQNTVYVCEGYATGLAIFNFTGDRVHVAFNLTNLEAVVRVTKEQFPNAKVILAADNDVATKEKIGKNPGLNEAERLHQEFGVDYVYPKTDGPASMDFADLWALEIEWNEETVVRVAGEPPPVPVSAPGHHKLNGGMAGLQPMQIQYTKQGKPILPPDSEVAEHILNFFGDELVKCENDFFYYTGTHWQIFGRAESDYLANAVKISLGNTSANKTKAVLALVSMYAPRAGTNLFQPNPFMANFLDGTLHIDNTYGKMRWEFKPHNKLDYITHTIPHRFGGDRTIRNETFEAMVIRICGGDADKIRAVKQMYGACLAPIFPHLFMLIGQANSGKSSLIIPGLKLLSDKNLCNVGPSEFSGFEMESMIGKLMNYDLDIDITQEIADSTIKKIEDRVPISIRRKTKVAVMAPLPAVHIFGGNGMPRTREQGSGAHNRRWTFIPLGTFNAGENYIRDFAQRAFDECPQGVINFALEGLEDLLKSNGIYFNPGRELLANWQRESDPIGNFLHECEDTGANCGDAVLITRTKDDQDKIERGGLWSAFVRWHHTACGRHPNFSKNVFYNQVRTRCTGEIKNEGHYYFKGFRSVPLGNEGRRDF